MEQKEKQGRCWLRSAAHWPTCWQEKALAVLPAPAWDARALSFVHHCIAAPVVEELVFRGAIQQLRSRWADGTGRRCRRCCLPCSTAPRPGMAWALVCGLGLGALPNAPAGYGRGCFCIH